MTLQLEYVILNAENNVMMNITTERKFSNERKSKKIRRFISSGKNLFRVNGRPGRSSPLQDHQYHDRGRGGNVYCNIKGKTFL